MKQQGIWNYRKSQEHLVGKKRKSFENQQRVQTINKKNCFLTSKKNNEQDLLESAQGFHLEMNKELFESVNKQDTQPALPHNKSRTR